MAKPEEAGIAWADFNGVAALSAHPDLRRVTVETAHGPLALPAPPARFDGATRTGRRVPELGEHTGAVRGEFGGAGQA